MALVVADRVQETSTTSGTGTLTLAGAVVGFQTFSTAIGNGNTTFYTIYDSTAYDWEVGIGTVGAGTLARTTVLSNSLGTTAKISFASNSKLVFCTYPAEKSINYDANDVATIGSTLGYTDTGIIASFASTVAGYNQVILQNKSTATNASANFNVSNDAGTAGSNYAELGINSSTFTGSGSFNIAGASYVASASTDLVLGTYGAYSIHFVTNSSTTDAMTIFNNGGISLGGFANPGIKNIAASKFVPGYTAITSAAGTTVLTADSNYYQNLVGTTTQTFRLPDATTLLVGTTFIFDNNSTDTLTVVDNASGPVDTIPGGAAGFVYLANNSTVAGSWNDHAFLPATYNFNATTANFGNATITNAVWNGTTIASGYGGTGLTTFTAANNAIYSTSSSALAAGTLPIQAGGTAATTFTANGVLYGNGTSALGVTAAGTTGQVLIATTSGAPSWGAVPTTAAVTSFQTSLSGLTPNTATTGAVTLAGTLGPTSGGTGLSAYTTGDIIYASATNTLSALADVATGNALISGGVGTAPLWGKIGLTTHVSGTLPVANGGTGQTTYTDGQLLIGNTTGNTLTKTTLTGTTNQVTVTNGSGSITLSLPSSINVNTTGSAATLTTARAIYGNNFDGSAALTQVIASTYGGTGNGFTKFTGPATAEKTFTLPNATATILTDNAVVTAVQGGTGQSTYAVGDLLQGGATNTLTKLAAVATGNALISGGVTTASSWGKIGLTTHVSGILPIANGGTNASAAGIAAFNNITGYTASGATGTTSTNIVFSTSPTLVTPTLGVASATSINKVTVTAPATSSTLTIADGSTLATSGAFSTTLTATGTTTVTLPTTGTLTTLAGTETLTNKRITPRVSTTTSSATPTINTDTTDQFGLTAQAVNITSFTTNLSGTPTNGQKLWIYIVGTAARTITWGASFEASTVALPTTTVTTNRLDVGFVWNAVTSKWRCVAVA